MVLNHLGFEVFKLHVVSLVRLGKWARKFAGNQKSVEQCKFVKSETRV